MTDLSQDQVDKRAAIQKTATIWGVIAGAVAGLIALWILGGQGGAVRYGGAVIIALAAGFLVSWASFKSGSKSAQCPKCGAAFSLSRSDHVETLVSSTDKEEREEQTDKSTKVTTWTEDTLDVVDTYTCAKCADVSTKSYKTTRRRDEKSVVEPFEPPRENAKSGKRAAAKADDAKPDGAKAGNPRKRRR